MGGCAVLGAAATSTCLTHPLLLLVLTPPLRRWRCAASAAPLALRRCKLPRRHASTCSGPRCPRNRPPGPRTTAPPPLPLPAARPGGIRARAEMISPSTRSGSRASAAGAGCSILYAWPPVRARMGGCFIRMTGKRPARMEPRMGPAYEGARAQGAAERVFYTANCALRELGTGGASLPPVRPPARRLSSVSAGRPPLPPWRRCLRPSPAGSPCAPRPLATFGAPRLTAPAAGPPPTPPLPRAPRKRRSVLS